MDRTLDEGSVTGQRRHGITVMPSAMTCLLITLAREPVMGSSEALRRPGAPAIRGLN